MLEQIDDARVVFALRERQSRLSEIVFQLYGGGGGKQADDAFDVAFARRLHQGRPAVFIAEINIRRILQQALSLATKAACCCLHPAALSRLANAAALVLAATCLSQATPT